jgi:two-component system response regulator NreC
LVCDNDAGLRVWLRGFDAMKSGGHMLRVLLIDDHAILRDGLSALLNVESDLEVVGQVGYTSEAVQIAGSLDPDLIITDIKLPVATAMKDIAELHSRCPSARLLALTAHNSADCIRAAFAAGADGYMLKEATRLELLSAVRAVLAGQRHLCPRSMAHVVDGYLDEPNGPPAVIGITAREREILTRIANGQSSKHMAMALDLSIKTIEKHRANLMRKLGLTNVAEVTRFALENGVLEEPAAIPDT